MHSLKAQVARGQTDVERAMHVVLYVLADAGPLRVGALAERLGTDPSTTSRQTGELVKQDLLRKLPDPDDGRASLLAVTEAGHAVVAAMKQRRHEHLARAVEGFDDDELDAFTGLLSRFADGLERARTETLRTAHSPQEIA
nr:MarR family transcriptional regulator [Kineococcus aurantiacus]